LAHLNRIAGTWLVEDADVIIDGTRIPLYGAHPTGVLIFTEDLYFSVVLSDAEVPPFASGDRMTGTADEDHSSVTRTLGLYGTYSLDAHGDFQSQIVLASTFPNWNGLHRDTAQLTETIEGDLMHEHLLIDDHAHVEITWRRASARNA
jgi:hypothetical protein